MSRCKTCQAIGFRAIIYFYKNKPSRWNNSCFPDIVLYYGKKIYFIETSIQEFNLNHNIRWDLYFIISARRYHCKPNDKWKQQQRNFRNSKPYFRIIDQQFCTGEFEYNQEVIFCAHKYVIRLLFSNLSGQKLNDLIYCTKVEKISTRLSHRKLYKYLAWLKHNQQLLC